jgi:uncharacterized membrane protein YvbJ
MKACPFCAEQIEDAARKCKHCGEYLDPSLRSVPVAETQVRKKKAAAHLNKLSWAFALFAFLAFGLGAKGVGQVLLGIAFVLAVGVHLKKAA